MTITPTATSIDWDAPSASTGENRAFLDIAEYPNHAEYQALLTRLIARTTQVGGLDTVALLALDDAWGADKPQ